MPSGNTNIMKQFRQNFNNIKEDFNSPFRVKSDDASINEFAGNCEGRYGITQEIQTQEESKLTCEDFVHDLELVLSTNKLKDESAYKEYIETVNSYIYMSMRVLYPSYKNYYPFLSTLK